MTYSPFQNYYGHDTTFIKRLTVEAYQEEIQLEEKELSGGVPLADHTNRKKDAYQFQKRRQALTSSQAKQSVSFSSKYPTYDYLGRELCVKYQMLENSMAETRRQQTQCDSEQHKQKICINTEIELDGKQSKVLSVRRTTQGGRKEENPECEYHWEESHQTANTTNHNNNIRFSRLSINTNSYHAPLQQQTHHNSQRSFSFYRDSRKTVLNKNLRDSSHPEGEEEEEENENNVKRLCDDKPAVVVEEKEKFVKKETPTFKTPAPMKKRRKRTDCCYYYRTARHAPHNNYSVTPPPSGGAPLER
ncbi:hypothetical protein AGDE_16502 [Angomonas deanei]|uniref:Uncharacterized protein n=1 Tax=Angomonas deanei TaxID=59799 RepID=A0A7G2C3T9_9TRYP|nr:hypothetical protein AGDE_16502 [Angomonas deanei]CAD2214360.1 hypothetical protein, conserved [Angomonas deanei]|eukprot:EPY16992.1 hypothetical protein AGDE_16502 [Angomonas deanei]